MYAVIASGGKQYRVAEGDRVKLEKLPVEEGETINIDSVLMVGEGDNIKVGAPFVKGGKVTASVVKHGRGEKILIFKMRRRKNSRRHGGHRQDFTEVKITEISG